MVAYLNLLYISFFWCMGNGKQVLVSILIEGRNKKILRKIVFLLNKGLAFQGFRYYDYAVGE